MKRNSVIAASLTLASMATFAGACSAQTPYVDPADGDIPQAENLEAKICSGFLKKPHMFPRRLGAHLGAWQKCELKAYKESEFGLDQILVLSWEGVTLTVEFQVPETAIYVVETEGKSPLTSEWFETAKDQMISSFFEIDWDRDEFPGPKSQHFISAEEGNNGQVWIERDASGAITWMRFSYAL